MILEKMIDGTSELYFDWILKLENIATVTNLNAKGLALRRSEGVAIKHMKALP